MILWMKRNLMLTGAALAAFFMILARAFTLGKKSDADVRAALSDWLRNK
ncbi:hypothetical protein [Bartonella sp. MF74HXZ]